MNIHAYYSGYDVRYSLLEKAKSKLLVFSQPVLYKRLKKGKDVSNLGHHLIGPSSKKPEQPRRKKPGQSGLAAVLTMFVTTALFPSQAQMREVREIWDYHELFMTLKPKSPLYEIISADWAFCFFPRRGASDMISNGLTSKWIV